MQPIDYHYALQKELPKLKASGWTVCGMAGHEFEGTPVYFVSRPAQGVGYKERKPPDYAGGERLGVFCDWRG
jgi:hypothetical protein